MGGRQRGAHGLARGRARPPGSGYYTADANRAGPGSPLTSGIFRKRAKCSTSLRLYGLAFSLPPRPPAPRPCLRKSHGRRSAQEGPDRRCEGGGAQSPATRSRAAVFPGPARAGGFSWLPGRPGELAQALALVASRGVSGRAAGPGYAEDAAIRKGKPENGRLSLDDSLLLQRCAPPCAAPGGGYRQHRLPVPPPIS